MPSKKSPSSMDRHIGSRIRMRRVLIGMSQEKLGERLGITFQQIQKYENGTNRVGSGRLHEIAAILDVPASFFFEGQKRTVLSKDPQASPPIPDLLSQRDSLQLLQAFDAIKDRKLRQAVVIIARALASQAETNEAEVSKPSVRHKAFSRSS